MSTKICVYAQSADSIIETTEATRDGVKPSLSRPTFIVVYFQKKQTPDAPNISLLTVVVPSTSADKNFVVQHLSNIPYFSSCAPKIMHVEIMQNNIVFVKIPYIPSSPQYEILTAYEIIQSSNPDCVLLSSQHFNKLHWTETPTQIENTVFHPPIFPVCVYSFQPKKDGKTASSSSGSDTYEFVFSSNLEISSPTTLVNHPLFGPVYLYCPVDNVASGTTTEILQKFVLYPGSFYYLGDEKTIPENALNASCFVFKGYFPGINENSVCYACRSAMSAVPI